MNLPYSNGLPAVETLQPTRSPDTAHNWQLDYHSRDVDRLLISCHSRLLFTTQQTMPTTAKAGAFGLPERSGEVLLETLLRQPQTAQKMAELFPARVLPERQCP